ncbi:MAG: hypothetical protein DSZ04_00500 [Sulfurimonas sp.]|nr:MAG: hypothetical protein DSZ04_00500 [Sulfurimonas sp.]
MLFETIPIQMKYQLEKKNIHKPVITEFIHSESIQKIIEKLELEYSQSYYFIEADKKLLKYLFNF